MFNAAISRGKEFTSALGKIKNKVKGFLEVFATAIKAKDWDTVKMLIRSFMIVFVPILQPKALASQVIDIKDEIRDNIKESYNYFLNEEDNVGVININSMTEENIANALGYVTKPKDYPGYAESWQKCFDELKGKFKDTGNYTEWAKKINNTKVDACKDAEDECEPCTYVGSVNNAFSKNVDKQNDTVKKIIFTVGSLAIVALAIITGSWVPVIFAALGAVLINTFTKGRSISNPAGGGATSGGKGMAGN